MDREALPRADDRREAYVQRRALASSSLSTSVPRTAAADASGFSEAINTGIWPVQLAGGAARPDVDVHAMAAHGTSGAGGALPHHGLIQRAFGRHDVSNVRAYVGGSASEAATAIGAEAYATGNRVAFAESPDLHLAAHEAAHVVQQRGGVQLSSGVGHAGDIYEQHADAVADRVVRGESAEQLLDTMAPSGVARASSSQLQRREIRVTAPADGARTVREAIARATPAEATTIATQLHAVHDGNGNLSFRVGSDHYTVAVAVHDVGELARLADTAAAATATGTAPAAPGSTTAPAPQITADLRPLGPGGAGGDVAPVEYISASGSGHTTTSIIMDRIVQLMHADRGLRFVDAARRAVHQHLIPDEPVASARVGGSDMTPTVRYALVIAQVDYPGADHDLHDVEDRTHAGAPARRVIEQDYGRDHTRVAHDAPRARMITEIRAGIDRVSADLHDGQQGELMVNFQGHGGTYGIDGVDDRTFTHADMVEMSTYAVSRHVHLVIVSDGCYGGTMTVVAQGLADLHLGARVDQAEGSGTLSHETATRLRAQLDQLREDLIVARRLTVQLATLDYPGAQAIAAAMTEVRTWLQAFERYATSGLPLLSGDVSAQLHDCWQQLVVDNVPVHTHDQVRTWRLRLDHLVSQIGAEVSAAHEEIALQLDLSGL